MTVFTTIILILFVGMLTLQFITAVKHACVELEIVFALEIIMFAYLAKTLM